MGWAPFGDRDGDAVLRYLDRIRTKLVSVKEDGALFLHQEYFGYATGLRMTVDRKWEALFGFGRRKPESPLEQHHCDLAAAVQIVTEEVVSAMAGEAKRLTGSVRATLASGSESLPVSRLASPAMADTTSSVTICTAAARSQ